MDCSRVIIKQHSASRAGAWLSLANTGPSKVCVPHVPIGGEITLFSLVNDFQCGLHYLCQSHVSCQLYIASCIASCFLSNIYSFRRENYQKKEKIEYLSHVFFHSFTLSTFKRLPTLNLPFSSFFINPIQGNMSISTGGIPLKLGRTEFDPCGGLEY